jgi:hypothetical protein
MQGLVQVGNSTPRWRKHPLLPTTELKIPWLMDPGTAKAHIMITPPKK